MNAIASAALTLVQQSKAFDADTHNPTDALLSLFPATRTLQTLASAAHKVEQGEALRALKARKVASLRKRAESPRLQAQRADELRALADIRDAVDTQPEHGSQLRGIYNAFNYVRQFPSVQYVTAFNPQSVANYPRNDPAYSTYTVAAIENGAIVAPITLRILKARDGMTIGAALFINYGSVHAFGYSGRVGGYGYHRASEAAERAFNSAGVTFAHAFGGSGDTATENALLSLAEFIGLRSCKVI